MLKKQTTNSPVRSLICFTAQHPSLNPKGAAFPFLNHYLQQACLSCIPHIDGSLRESFCFGRKGVRKNMELYVAGKYGFCVISNSTVSAATCRILLYVILCHTNMKTSCELFQTIKQTFIPASFVCLSNQIEVDFKINWKVSSFYWMLWQKQQEYPFKMALRLVQQ